MASDDGNRPATGEGTQLVTASEKRLIENIRADVGTNMVTSFSSAIYINRENRTTYDMTSEAKIAIVESNRMQYAVPAQERTRRSIQQTIRFLIAGAILVFFGYLAYLKPESGKTMIGLSVVLSGGIVLPELFNREKRKELPAPKED